MSPKQDKHQPSAEPAVEPEIETPVETPAPAEASARDLERALRLRTLQDAHEWLTDYEVALLDWAIRQERLTLDRAVEIAQDMGRRMIPNELQELGIATSAEERTFAGVFYAEVAEEDRRETLIKLLLPRVRHHLTLFILERLIAAGRLTFACALELAEEANARLDRPAVPDTLTVMMERGLITDEEIDEFRVRMQRSRERNARSNTIKHSPEQMLLATLRRTALHEAGASAWNATLLDYLLEQDRISMEDAKDLAEAGSSSYAILDVDMIDTGLIRHDEVEGLRSSIRYEDMTMLWAGLNAVEADEFSELRPVPRKEMWDWVVDPEAPQPSAGIRHLSAARLPDSDRKELWDKVVERIEQERGKTGERE